MAEPQNPSLFTLSAESEPNGPSADTLPPEKSSLRSQSQATKTISEEKAVSWADGVSHVRPESLLTEPETPPPSVLERTSEILSRKEEEEVRTQYAAATKRLEAALQSAFNTLQPYIKKDTEDDKTNSSNNKRRRKLAEAVQDEDEPRTVFRLRGRLSEVDLKTIEGVVEMMDTKSRVLDDLSGGSVLKRFVEEAKSPDSVIERCAQLRANLLQLEKLVELEASSKPADAESKEDEEMTSDDAELKKEALQAMKWKLEDLSHDLRASVASLSEDFLQSIDLEESAENAMRQKEIFEAQRRKHDQMRTPDTATLAGDSTEVASESA